MSLNESVVVSTGMGNGTGTTPVGVTTEGTRRTWFTDITTALTTTVINVNKTKEDEDNSFVCNDWLDAQHAVFQLANLCILISFLTPSSFKHHFFFLRIMLNLGYVLIVIWAALFVCMPDILVWNAAFFVFNSFHLVYLGFKIVPDKVPKTLEEVYTHTFKSLHITRKQFKDLAEFGSMMLVAKGAIYAKQGQNQTGQKLSILIKGRLKVAYDDVYLHSVDANQFVDSPEFDSTASAERGEYYQVTISAIEDSLVFTWPYKRLREHLTTSPQLRHIFQQIIGKDISQKLYEIQERLMSNPGFMNSLDRRRSSMVNVRHSIVSSSTTNLTKLNCLQGCIVQNDPNSALPSNGTYETSV